MNLLHLFCHNYYRAAATLLHYCSMFFWFRVFWRDTVGNCPNERHISLYRVAVALYVTVIRGTPILAPDYVFFSYAFKHWHSYLCTEHCHFSNWINSSAYISQIVRSGISSVSRGQIEAAKTLGVSSFDITRYIILPQALRVVVPALGNEFITLIKESSLASAIGVIELY